MIKIEYIYIYNDTKNTKSGSCVLCIILYFIVFLKYVYFVFSDPDRKAYFFHCHPDSPETPAYI